MTSAKIISVLNQLMRLHSKSLVSYLNYASPTWHRGDEKAKTTLSVVTEQQSEMADRIGELVVGNGEVADRGAYPMLYTAFHDLSFEFLLAKLIEEQEDAVSTIESCVAQLPQEPRAYELAQEALGMAKGHLESLTELRGTPAT